MKIAVWHNLPSGGAKRVLFDQVKGLLDLGHSVEAWAPPTADLDFLPLREIISEHNVPLGPSEPSTSAASHPAPAPAWNRLEPLRKLVRTGPVAMRIAAMDRHCRLCAEEIAAGDFDVLLATNCRYLGVSQIGSHVDIPSALYVGEPRRALYEAQPRLHWTGIDRPYSLKEAVTYLPRYAADVGGLARRRAMARAEARNARAFDLLLANSLYTRESVLRDYGLEARVCYPGINTDQFRPLPGDRDGTVLAVGELALHKRPSLIVRSMALLPQPRPKLVWVANRANAGLTGEVKALADQLAVELDLRIGTSEGDLLTAFNQASVLVQASRLEPLGLAVLEAAACELPVVAVAEGGPRETVVEGVTGLLVDSTPVAIAKAVSSILSDPTRAEQMGAEGRRMISDRWGLPAAARRLEDALLSVARPQAATDAVLPDAM